MTNGLSYVFALLVLTFISFAVSDAKVSFADGISAAQMPQKNKTSVPDIRGIQAPLTLKAGQAWRGKAIAASRSRGNCLACHKISILDSETFHGTIGPKLDKVGTKFSAAQLRQLIFDARVFYPTTIMPPYFVKEGLYQVANKHDGKTILSPQEVEDVVAFLTSLR